MPYILVLGQNGDATVDDVIHWLKFLQPCKIIRINDSDRIDFINIEALTNSAASFTLEINGTPVRRSL